MYWAQALAAQDEDQDLKARFAPVAQALASQEGAIVEQLNGVQGASMDIGGYYKPDPAAASAAMRPSEALNQVIASI
jgi:isocitrate dehydrogenase